jgi:SAM-dependent methyltransferase
MKTLHLTREWNESGGVFVSQMPVSADPEYPEHLRDWIASIELKHFWFRSRAKLVAAVVKSWVSTDGWLELGCGTGSVLAEVGRKYQGPCFGQEVSRRAIEIARSRTKADLYLCPADQVPVRELDGVGLFDVIEHLPDDVGAIKIAAGYVKSGGAVLITVPSHPCLWSQMDEASGHQRRYSRGALLKAMASANLQVESCRPFFGLLLPGLLLRRMVRSRHSHSVLRTCLQPPPRFINAVLRVATELEGVLCQKGLTVFGTSWLALGRKI